MIILLNACNRVPDNIPPRTTPTIITLTETPFPIESPTAQSVTQTFICTDINTNWDNDWQIVIAVLDSLIAKGQSCGDESLLSKKYAALFIYANSLEELGETDSAIDNYTNAFNIDANRTEALNALIRLDAIPEATAVPCNSPSPPLPDPAPPTTPDSTQFVTAKDNKLVLQDETFKVKGVNYYPRHAPRHKFLQESESVEIETELALIKEAGFNTIRVFLWYDPLFICQPEDAIPNEVVFQKVDEIIQLAKNNDLKLIMTLNDLPDLIFRPLYTDWERYDAQTTYIVRRYRNEPAILTWDLRNEGDLDYGARPSDEAKFEEEDVVNWLAHTSQLVRENDPNHLITAGWWGDPQATSEYVDILSFHHWYDAITLQERIETYTENSNKPILLEEIGYHSWQEASQDQRNEEMQANLLNEAIQITESDDIAGWLIWTAFDFEPEPGQAPNYEHFFGLWHSDLSPKPSLTQLFNQD